MPIKLKNKKKEPVVVEVKKEPEKQDYQFFYFEGKYLNFNNIVSIKEDRDYENLMEITYAHPLLDYDLLDYDYHGSGTRIYKTKYETFTMGKSMFDEYLKFYLDSKTLRISK